MKKINFTPFLYIMRISAYVFLVTALFFNFSFARVTSGQKKVLSIHEVNLDLSVKDKTIFEVFSLIEQKTSFKFTYDKKMLRKLKRVTISGGKRSLGEILSEIANQAYINFKQVNNLIAVLKAVDGQSTSEIEVIIVETNVSGKVTNEDGEGLPGASVVAKGTATGTITDAEGNYNLTLPDDVQTLVFSYIGYVLQEADINGRSVIDVTLELDVQQLSEIVVTGYTSQSRRSITGAVSTVEARELSKNPANSVEQQLQGKVSGVDIVTSGDPGGGSQVRIRGLNNFDARNPLYIIDGAPSEAGLNEINPNDIEIGIGAKDGSAASIYGARAANGVVLITTKKGRRGEPARVTYNTFHGVDVDPGRLNVLNAEEWGRMEFLGQQASVRGTDAEANFEPSHPTYGTGTPQIPQFINGDPNLPYDPVTNRIMRSADTDWYDVLTQTAYSQSHSLSILGGGQNSRYGMSFGYLDREGTRINTSFQRYSTRFNSEFTLLDDRLRVGENVTIAYSELNGRRGIGTNDRFTFHPLIPRRDEGGNFGGTLNGILGLGTNFNNPEADQIRLRNAIERRLRSFGNVYIEGDILTNLTLRSLVAIDYIQNNNTTFTPERPEGGIPGGTLNEFSRFSTSTTWTNTLNYSVDVGDHVITALIGTEAINLVAKDINYTGADFFTEDLDFITISSAGVTQSILGGRSERRLSSIFGKIDYSFKDKYLINATVRRDGSSALGPSDRFDVFPAFGVGWVLSEESFMSNNSLVDLLKIRAGWGTVGNQNSLSSFGFASVFSQDPTAMSTGYDIGATNGTAQANGIALLGRGNPDLVWETSKTLNVGIDFSIVGDKVSGSIEWYDKRTKDLLLRPPVPLASGVAAPAFVNSGEIQNKGIDLLLAYEGRVGVIDFQVTGIITRYKNEVLDIDGNPESFFLGPSGNPNVVAARTQVGHPIGSFYGLIADGVIQSGPDAGNFDFRDLDNNGTIDLDDQTFIGNPHPDFTYSLNISANYKNFDFTAFFRGSQGNDIWQWTKGLTDFQFREGFNRSTRVLDAWRPDNPSNSLAEFNLNTADFNQRASTYYVENGSYFKLQTIQFGYTLVDFFSLNNVRLYLQGQNVFTATKYSGIDPEIFENGGLELGVDRGTGYIVPRTFLLGLNVTF